MTMKGDAMSKTSTFTLPRDGQRPLRFTGTLLAEASGAYINGKDQNRYYILKVCQHTDGSFVVAWQYRSQWQGEAHRDEVFRYENLDQVVAVLENFDPVEWVEGYKHLLSRQPSGYGSEGQHSEYGTRQRDLEDSIKRQYAMLIQELFDALGVVEDI
jgi:hypothetical protein